MNASSLKPDAKQSGPADSASVSRWLDAVAAGSCTQKEFLQKVETLEEEDSDAPWEVLSLLDQYLRRELISRDVHVSLKARLQQRYMGFGSSSAASEHTDVHIISPEPARPPMPPQPARPAISPEPARPVPVSAGTDSPPQIGDVLRGRYQLVDILRSDPPGAVFEAIDQFKVQVPDVSHRVAIAVFNEASRRDPGLLQRICGLQSLSHPGIERVFEVDEDSGALLLITESLSGVSLQQLIDQGGTRLTLPASQTIVQSVASALVHAHSHNVFHGDVRAENVFITDAGEVRLRGFELIARDMPANPKGDRLAFSWFAYELLSGQDGGGGDRDSRLREPPGVTREQWRALRLTMTGKEDTAGNVLTAFGGANNPGPVVLLRDGERARARRMGAGGWMASGLVAAILVVAGYFILTSVVLNHPKADAQPVLASAPAPKADAQPVVASAPAPKAGAQPAVASAPAPKADAQPVVAGAPGPNAPAPQVAEVVSANVAADTVPVAPAPHVKAKPVVAAPRPSRALIDLPSATATVAGDQPVAKIWVRRRGGLTGEVSFRWWTESGSARVDQDFRAITPRTATIDDGARGVELLVPLVANPARQQSRTFYVKIDEPGERATLGDQTLMQVSIVPPGYVQAPEQR